MLSILSNDIHIQKHMAIQYMYKEIKKEKITFEHVSSFMHNFIPRSGFRRYKKEKPKTRNHFHSAVSCSFFILCLRVY